MISMVDRKRIYIFVGIAYALSMAVAVVLSLTNAATPEVRGWLGMLMFAPAIASLVARAVTGEGPSNLLLRPNLRRGWPFYLAALFLPALAILAGGALYYLLFPSRFDPSMTYAREELGMTAAGGAAAPLSFLIIQTGYAIARSLLDLPWTLGEELGWRGYLQQKLMPLGPRKAVLLVGAIWAVWHWPAIFLLGSNYGFGYWGAPVVGPLLFVWCLLSGSMLYGWLTVRSGSVWPAAIAHGVNNAASMLMVWFIRGPISPLLDPLIGPTSVGIVGSLGYVLLALPIFFIPRALAPAGGPQPGHPEHPPIRLRRGSRVKGSLRRPTGGRG